MYCLTALPSYLTSEFHDHVYAHSIRTLRSRHLKCLRRGISLFRTGAGVVQQCRQTGCLGLDQPELADVIVKVLDQVAPPLTSRFATVVQIGRASCRERGEIAGAD